MRRLLAPALLVGLGACSETDLNIHTVSEYNQTIPVGGVHIQIDDEPWTTTDEAGALVVTPIGPAPHTVRVFQQVSGRNEIGMRDYVYDDLWELIDVENGELVLPVDGSFVDLKPCAVEGIVHGGAGATTTVQAENTLWATIEDGAFTLQTEITPSPLWLHALAVTEGAAPESRFAYAKTSVAISGSGDTCGGEGVDLSLEPAGARQISGRVVIPAGISAEESWVKFGVQLSADDQKTPLAVETIVPGAGETTFEGWVPDVGKPFVQGFVGGRCTFDEAELVVCGPGTSFYANQNNLEDLEVALPAPEPLTAPTWSSSRTAPRPG